MSKTYKGYELMSLVSKGKLSMQQRVNSLSLDYENCTIKFVLKDIAINVMDLDFKLIEDEIDIQNIKEYETTYTERCIDKEVRDKINELVRALKQLDRKIEKIQI